MKYRKLGKTNLEVSEIGYGSWGLGGEWGKVTEQDAVNSLKKAFDLGVNFYDTALVYGNGQSEQIVGKAFAGERDKVIIASKIPPKNYQWPVSDIDPIRNTFPADWIEECVNKSLENLGTDYLDVMQLHAWTPGYLEEPDWLEGLRKVKEAGKVRFFGVSANDWDPYGPTELIQSGLIDTVQVIYNIFEQRPAEILLPEALAHKVGIIVRVPFEEGLLTGQMGAKYQFEEGDWRADWLTPDRLKEAARRVEFLREFLSPNCPTLPHLALKFALSHPAVSTVIPGMRKAAHVSANCAASDGQLLTEEELMGLQDHRFIHGWAYPWSQV